MHIVRELRKRLVTNAPKRTSCNKCWATLTSLSLSGLTFFARYKLILDFNFPGPSFLKLHPLMLENIQGDVHTNILIYRFRGIQ